MRVEMGLDPHVRLALAREAARALVRLGEGARRIGEDRAAGGARGSGASRRDGLGCIATVCGARARGHAAVPAIPVQPHERGPQRQSGVCRHRRRRRPGCVYWEQRRQHHLLREHWVRKRWFGCRRGVRRRQHTGRRRLQCELPVGRHALAHIDADNHVQHNGQPDAHTHIDFSAVTHTNTLAERNA